MRCLRCAAGRAGGALTLTALSLTVACSGRRSGCGVRRCVGYRCPGSRMSDSARSSRLHRPCQVARSYSPVTQMRSRHSGANPLVKFAFKMIVAADRLCPVLRSAQHAARLMR